MATKTLHHAHAYSTRKPHLGWLGLGLLVIALSGGVAGWLLWAGDRNAIDPTDALVAQMQLAASGKSPPAIHAWGGSLRTVYTNGRLNVIATQVPSKACVQVGWRLAKSGTIIVNGVLPMRLSAAKLSELCDGGATLMWVPN